jgi:hypothetical protein
MHSSNPYTSEFKIVLSKHMETEKININDDLNIAAFVKKSGKLWFVKFSANDYESQFFDTLGQCREYIREAYANLWEARRNAQITRHNDAVHNDALVMVQRYASVLPFERVDNDTHLLEYGRATEKQPTEAHAAITRNKRAGWRVVVYGNHKAFDNPVLLDIQTITDLEIAKQVIATHFLRFFNLIPVSVSDQIFNNARKFGEIADELPAAFTLDWRESKHGYVWEAQHGLDSFMVIYDAAYGTHVAKNGERFNFDQETPRYFINTTAAKIAVLRWCVRNPVSFADEKEAYTANIKLSVVKFDGLPGRYNDTRKSDILSNCSVHFQCIDFQRTECVMQDWPAEHMHDCVADDYQWYYTLYLRSTGENVYQSPSLAGLSAAIDHFAEQAFKLQNYPHWATETSLNALARKVEKDLIGHGFGLGAFRRLPASTPDQSVNDYWYYSMCYADGGWYLYHARPGETVLNMGGVGNVGEKQPTLKACARLIARHLMTDQNLFDAFIHGIEVD